MSVIAHLSDMHLDESPLRLQRFRAVLAQVASLARVDALLLSGDLADHGGAGEYEQLLSALPQSIPILMVPGNHDLTAPLQAALARCADTSSLNLTLNGTLDIGGVRIIGLDSHIDRNDHGKLGAEAIEYAHTQLSSAEGPALLAMHHPPVPVGHHVMDRLGLTNPDELAAVIRAHQNVLGVLTGHVHTALATTFGGVPVIGAPGIASTMRLGSLTDPIADSEAMPGLALHTIDGFALRTVFHYLSPSALDDNCATP